MHATYPSLNGKSAYVTGGASGIGAALVRCLHAQGAAVAFVDLDEAAGAGLAAELKASGKTPVRFRRVDATDISALQGDIRAAAAEHGRLDVLMNNVANDVRHAALDINEDRWRRLMAVNLDASFFAVQAAIPLLTRQKRSSVINFSSINALLGPPGMPAYVAAKSALLGLTKALAREFGGQGVRVNAILPGWVATARQLDTWLTPVAEQEWSRHVALQGRIAETDIAALALFLAADDSAMITGQNFVIDAGRT